MNPSTHPEFPSLIFCRKCGRSAGKDPRKINNQLDKSGNKLTKWCTQQKLPREQWAEQPITLYQYSKKHQDDLQERWCTKPIKGHQLEWNGKLGVTRFSEDEGLVTCKLCKQSWPTVNIAKNPGKETLLCTGTSTHIDDWTEQTTNALARWNTENPNSHCIAIDHARRRWKCTRCDIHGFNVISTDTTRKTAGQYVALFTKTVSTACQQHAPREAVT